MKKSVHSVLRNGENVTKIHRSVIACDMECLLLNILNAATLSPRLLQRQDRTIITEYEPGVTFLDLLEASARGEIPLSDALCYFSKLADWLLDFQEAAHQAFGNFIVLSDFHLSNFLLTESGRVKGLAFEAWQFGGKAQNAAALLSWLGTYQLDHPGCSEAIYRQLRLKILSQYPLSPDVLDGMVEDCRLQCALRRKTQPMMRQTTAVILSGGKSSRMHGEPKVSLALGRYPFGEHILYALQCFDTLVLSLGSHMDAPPLPLPIYRDLWEDLGPIGGIYSALRCCETPFIFVTACDTPYVSEALIRLLFSQYRETDDCVIAVVDQRTHPLFGIYKRSVLPVLEGQIQNGDYRIMNALSKLQVRTVPLGSDWADSLQNINTREEYQVQLQNAPAKKRLSPLTFMKKES